MDRSAWAASAKASVAATRHEPRRPPPAGWSPPGGWLQPGPHEPRREVAEIAPMPASKTAATEQAEPRREVVDIARFAASSPACIRSAARTAARCMAWFLRCLCQRERQSGMLYVSVTFLPSSCRSRKCSRMICSSRCHSMLPSGFCFKIFDRKLVRNSSYSSAAIDSVQRSASSNHEIMKRGLLRLASPIVSRSQSSSIASIASVGVAIG